MPPLPTSAAKDGPRSVAAIRPDVLAALHSERSDQLLFLHTMRDAAILAGEQVQDVRLEFLEDPPDVAGSDVLFDLLISLALGAGASVAIRRFAEVGTRAIAVMRAPLVKRNGAYRLAAFTQQSLTEARLKILPEAVESLTDPSKARTEFWRKVIEDVLGVGADLAKRKAREAVKAVRAHDPIGGGGAARGGDTAGVAVRRSVLAATRLQERAIDRFFADYEAQIRSDNVTHAELLGVQDLLLALRSGPSQEPQSNEQLERQLSLIFEASIWFLHVGGRAPIEKLAQRTDRPIPTYDDLPRRDPNAYVRPAPAPIVRYWLRRFPHPSGNGNDSFFTHVTLTARTSDKDAILRTALADLTVWFGRLYKHLVLVQNQIHELGLEPLEVVKLK